jgi:hypothetical protein
MFALLLVGGALVVGAAHEFTLGAAALAECDVATAQGDVPRAIDAARAAAEAVAPASPYPARGYARLVAIAGAAEARGDDATANAAWRSVRAAALATRTLARTPAYLVLAEEGLARVAWHARTGAVEGDLEAFRAAMLGRLAQDDVPAGWTFVLLGAGAAAFFGGVLAMLVAEGGSRRAVATRAAVAVAGLAMALVACLRG